MAGKALVTGGAGFIGSHLSELLLDEGWEVFALDDLSTGSPENVAHLSERREFHLTVESVLSPSVVSELVHKCDAVFHLAAAVGVRLIVERPGHTAHERPRDGERSRLRGPVRKVGARRVELGGLRRPPGRRPAAPRGRPADLRPDDGEALGLRRLEGDGRVLALARHEEEDLRCVIVCLFNTVGPRQSGEYGNVIPRFVQNALAGEPLEVHGDGSQTRCFCHVNDVVRGLHGLMTGEDVAGKIYNVGSTEVVTILELAKRVQEATGSSSELAFVPYAEVYGQGIEEMFQRIPSIEKIRDAIGWEPATDLNAILADVIEHVRRQAERPGVHVG